jgi:CoA-transferase family III
MEDPRLARWAESGAMALTGWPERAVGPPAHLVDGVTDVARAFPGLDGLAVLGERAALMGLWRRGGTSCGGSCKLIRAADGWLAVSLPRADDVEAVPAWLELDDLPSTVPATWRAVARAAAEQPSSHLVARASLLGLPVSRVGEADVASPRRGVTKEELGTAPPCAVDGALVVDLSALWAGPLCGDLLAGAGARVVKVESIARPDGARRGPSAFFDLLNGRKRSVALNLREAEGIRLLGSLLRSADVVIESSRPRALRQMGFNARDLVRAGGPRVWVSITGHGRSGDDADRVGFGDDAAAAGGLVVWDAGRPLFCADAVADPLSGMAAAHACLEALAEGGRWLLDVSMAAVCRGLDGPTLATPSDLVVAEPRARDRLHAAPAMGADTGSVLAEVLGDA